MRLFSLLLIVIGLGGAVLIPWYQSNFTGYEVTSQTVYRPETGPTEFSLELSPRLNPLRVVLEVRFQPGQKLASRTLDFQLLVSQAETPVLKARLEVPTAARGAPEGDQITGMNSPVFPVANDGIYTISVTPIESDARQTETLANVVSVTAKVRAKVTEPVLDFQWQGIMLAILGFYLLMRTRRQKRAEQSGEQRWGR